MGLTDTLYGSLGSDVKVILNVTFAAGPAGAGAVALAVALFMALIQLIRNKLAVNYSHNNLLGDQMEGQ